MAPGSSIEEAPKTESIQKKLAASTPGAFGKGCGLVLFNYPGRCDCVETCIATKGFRECPYARVASSLSAFCFGSIRTV